MHLKKTCSFLATLLLFVALALQIIQFNDDVIDGIYLTGLGAILGLTAPGLYFKTRRVLSYYNKCSLIDRINQPSYKKIRVAPYIYIISIFVCILSVTALNNFFSISERTEQFTVEKVGNKYAGKTSYRYALLKRDGKEVVYRLSPREVYEEHQLVVITLKKGILGFWYP
jgi:hypothetical protein